MSNQGVHSTTNYGVTNIFLDDVMDSPVSTSRSAVSGLVFPDGLLAPPTAAPLDALRLRWLSQLHVSSRHVIPLALLESSLSWPLCHGNALFTITISPFKFSLHLPCIASGSAPELVPISCSGCLSGRPPKTVVPEARPPARLRCQVSWF